MSFCEVGLGAREATFLEIIEVQIWAYQVNDFTWWD